MNKGAPESLPVRRPHNFRSPTRFLGDGAPATSLPWIFRLHPKHPLTALGLPATILSSPGGPPPPPLRSSSRRRGSAQGTGRVGDISPVSAAHKLLATPRALHGEAPVFTALRCVYTHFGNGSKPAGRPKNAVESTESFPEAGAGSGAEMRGGGHLGRWVRCSTPRGLRRGGVRHSKRLRWRQTLGCWVAPRALSAGARRPRRGEPEFTCTASAQLRRSGGMLRAPVWCPQIKPQFRCGIEL